MVNLLLQATEQLLMWFAVVFMALTIRVLFKTIAQRDDEIRKLRVKQFGSQTRIMLLESALTSVDKWPVRTFNIDGESLKEAQQAQHQEVNVSIKEEEKTHATHFTEQPK